MNLAGPLEILAKVWLHKFLETGVVPSKLAELRTLLSEPWEGDLPPCFIPFRFSSHQPPNKRLACVSLIDNCKISLLEQESEELQQGTDSKALSMLWR